MTKIKLWPLALLALVGVLGCNRANIAAGDLAGTWVMKQGSREVLPSPLKNASPRILLQKDGTFIASEMPGLLYGDQRGANLDAGTGTWKLVSREGRQEIQVNFYSITAGSTQLPVPYGTQIMVSKPWSTVNMEYYIGDQDQGVRIELEKK
ncbi:MAG TPA: hypothetical protein VN577_03535 [Terriglobales bacterium]|nr:hypothetical protein [Terriglobales bacterium]